MESVSQQLKFEAESLRKDLASAEEAVEKAENSLNKASSEEIDLQIQVGQQKTSYDEAKDHLSEIEGQIAEVVAIIKKLTKEKNDLTKSAEVATLNCKKLSVKVDAFQKGKYHAERIVSSLKSKYAWIESEKSFFGVVGGDYDFESIDPSEMSNKLKNLKQEQSSLVSSHTCFQHFTKKKPRENIFILLTKYITSCKIKFQRQEKSTRKSWG